MEHKRIKVIQKNPNPLFKKWLKEWIDDAEKKKKKISKVYQRALDSLNKYPLTLFSGHDCAILESFGPKICQMLDEKLEQHLNGRLDLFQQKSYKEKIGEVQRREVERVQELVKSVEAAILTDTTFGAATLENIQEDEEMPEDIQLEISIPNDNQSPQDLIEDLEIENFPPDDDVEIPEDLLSSAEEDPDDTFQRLLKKYDPENATQQKTSKKRTKQNENVIKRQKISSGNMHDDVVDLSGSPQPSPVLPLHDSPISTMPKTGTRLKRFRTFDNGKTSHLAGPSYASSPISSFLNVEVNQSPMSPIVASNEYEDSFDRLVGEKNFASPIPVVEKPAATKKPGRKPANPNLRKEKEVFRKETVTATQSVVHARSQLPSTQTIPEEDEDEIKFTSIDEINPQDYNVILLVDIGETSGKSNASVDETLVKLKDNNVKNEVRKLNVGDFLWVAQHKTEKSKEFVLPYIVERKRLDDLSSSIKDGRFHEQKFRLKKSGIENVIYLIENHIKAGKVQCGLPFTTLLQAATNTQIHSKFQVKFTENNQHTILFLTVMTTFIENIFKNKAPIKFKLMDFNKFNQSAVKQRKCTVRETFIKQLLALKGLSVDVALEITNNYSTPTDLFEAYRSLSKTDGENFLTKFTIGELKRKIPKNVSKTIYNFYMCDKI